MQSLQCIAVHSNGGRRRRRDGEAAGQNATHRGDDDRVRRAVSGSTHCSIVCRAAGARALKQPAAAALR